jgi:hypothetical protein
MPSTKFRKQITTKAVQTVWWYRRGFIYAKQSKPIRRANARKKSKVEMMLPVSTGIGEDEDAENVSFAKALPKESLVLGEDGAHVADQNSSSTWKLVVKGWVSH